MKLIHTADWHLGAKLCDRDRLPEQAQFLDWLAGLLREERPDLLLVAGDVFDTHQPSPAAQRLYYDLLAKVVRDRLCTRVAFLGGNHDSAALLSVPEKLLEPLGVRVVARRTESPEGEVVVVPGADGKPGLAVAAVPFLSKADLANEGAAAGAEGEREARLRTGFLHHYRAVAEAARAAAPGVPLVVAGHGVLAGCLSKDIRPERLRPVGGVEAFPASGLPEAEYTAFGHLHLPQAVEGRETVRYSGAPLPMSFFEAGKRKSVTKVVFGAAGEPPAVEEVPVPEFRKLVAVKGTPTELLDEVKRLAGGGPCWVSLSSTVSEDSMEALWEAVKCLTKDTGVEVLVQEAPPPVQAASGRAAMAGGDLRTATPMEVGLLKLQEAGLPEEEFPVYERMLEEAVDAAGEGEGGEP